MRRIALLAVGGLLIGACADTTAPEPEAPVADAPGGVGNQDVTQEAPFVPGRVLVRFASGADAPGLARAAGGQIDRVLGVGVHVLSVPVNAEARVVQALARSPNVVFAEPDYLKVFGDPASIPVDDPYIGYKWDLDNDGSIYSSTGAVLASTGAADADMDWKEAVEALGSASGSARVGIMDSGIRNDHQEFTGRIAVQYDFFDGDGDAEDDNGHGSHVAGIAAAATDNGIGVAGVAFTGNVDFAIAKVCGAYNPFQYGCPSSAIADGIRWAVDNGADVLNLSLGGGGGSTTTRSALQYARANGVLPICAAGNDGGPVSYPGAWPECVAVSATDWGDDLASYSNFGAEVVVAAPGGDFEDSNGYSYILSAYNGSSSHYAFLAGTSMASPQVAGLGALLHVLGVASDTEKVSVMTSTADDLGAPNADDLYGAGRVNVAAAVAAATGGGGGGGGGGGNAAPSAGFEPDCMELACVFTDNSSDSDGSIVSWSWDFGDGAGSSTLQNPLTYTYGAPGTYTVVLTVTDDGGASDTYEEDVEVGETPPAGGIELTAGADKNRGRHEVSLTWTGATSTDVDIYRDGGFLRTETNDGSYVDKTNERGGRTYVYRVCEQGSDTACSNEVTVVY